MRVIAGSAKRTVLVAPAGQFTRPTADRVKESLFNIISHNVPGARFLDLFCGSGGIGIEALSRGADFAIFVDSSTEAIKATRVNLEKTRFTSSAVLHMPIESAMSRLVKNGHSFDIIFADPPYGRDFEVQVLKLLHDYNLLAKDGIIIIETGIEASKIEASKDEGQTNTQQESQQAYFEKYEIRKYGSAMLSFYKAPT